MNLLLYHHMDNYKTYHRLLYDEQEEISKPAQILGTTGGSLLLEGIIFGI